MAGNEQSPMMIDLHKRYNCKLCTMSFRESHMLDKHLRKHMDCTEAERQEAMLVHEAHVQRLAMERVEKEKKEARERTKKQARDPLQYDADVVGAPAMKKEKKDDSESE